MDGRSTIKRSSVLVVEKGEMSPLFRFSVIFLALFVASASFAYFTYYAQPKIIVAVVDTGLDLKQVRFRFVATQGFNTLNSNQTPQDDNGHGTQVSSAIHFFEPRAKIMPIKAIPRSGVATKEELAQGIIAAVDRGAKIINISAGVVSPSPDLEKAVKYAEERSVLLVAAAGSSGMNVEYPASYPFVIAVGGVNHSGARLSNSNTGHELDLIALGEYATNGLRGECLHGAGTSLAVPVVSAYVAKIILDNPDLNTEQVKNVLLRSVRDIGEQGKDDETGYGLLKLIRTPSNVCK